MENQIEIWKKIKEIDGFYEISNLGRVKSMPRIINSSIQKCGFRITGIDIDFFIRCYQEEIFENGIQCRDMIRLTQYL